MTDRIEKDELIRWLAAPIYTDAVTVSACIDGSWRHSTRASELSLIALSHLR